MTNPKTPEQLSADLDRYLPAGTSGLPASKSDDLSVNAAVRLASAPRPVLTMDVRAQMKARMLAAVPVTPAAPSPGLVPVMRPVFRYLAAGSAAAAVLLSLIHI